MEHKKAYSHICRRKTSFREKAARLRVDEIKEESGNILHPYQCNVCNKWHLTKSNSQKRDQIKKRVVRKQIYLSKQYKREIDQEAEYWTDKLK